MVDIEIFTANDTDTREYYDMENLDPFGKKPELPPGPFDNLDVDELPVATSSPEDNCDEPEIILVSKKKTTLEKLGSAFILFFVLIVYSYLIFSAPGAELIRRFKFVDNKPEYVPLIQSASVSAVGLAVSLFLSFG